jgi:hypothetical protein
VIDKTLEDSLFSMLRQEHDAQVERHLVTDFQLVPSHSYRTVNVSPTYSAVKNSQSYFPDSIQVAQSQQSLSRSKERAKAPQIDAHQGRYEPQLTIKNYQVRNNMA